MSEQNDRHRELKAEIEKLKQTIAALEAQRGILDDVVIETSLASLRDKLAEAQMELDAWEMPGWADRAEGGSQEVKGVDTSTPIGRYFAHVIGQNRYLQLQGIRSGGRLLNIELERIYITLRTTPQRTIQAEEEWLRNQSQLAPGERQRQAKYWSVGETVVSVNEALLRYRRLVVLGDPGSGKTTLLRYLALVYARDLAHKDESVKAKLELKEEKHLPVFIPLRQLADFLQVHYPQDDGTEGHGRLLTFLYRRLESDHVLTPVTISDTYEPSLTQFRQKLVEHFDLEELHDLCFDVGVDDENLKGQTKKGKARELIKHMRRHGRLSQLVKIVKESRPHIQEKAWPEISESVLNEVPTDFFDHYLYKGKAIVLFDGLDEVSNPAIRRRVARLIESFIRAYPQCRIIVTSRIVGYTGAARLGEAFVTTTVRDFTMADIKQFLTYWHQLVIPAQSGSQEQVVHQAAKQTNHLMQMIQENERIRELAINPLMLTVLALVHRDRVKLPDRRAELYAEAVDVLLGKWDEARGVQGHSILGDKPFDAGDKRLILQSVALHMHEQAQKEIDVGDLRDLLVPLFSDIIIKGDRRAARQAVDRFLTVIRERTGLLVARGDGVFAFSHLTFQEYLAALAIAGQDDYVDYTLSKTADVWWQEVILLEAGYLSTQSRERTTRLIQAIADREDEPEPYHNLVLAAQCLRDAGRNRILGDLETIIQERLRADIELEIAAEDEANIRAIIDRKAIATQALIRSGSGYWTQPYGEPEWVLIPAGEFIMGSGPKYVEAFQIGRVPITNAQYHLFVQATGHKSPERWQDNRPPKEKESHPVVYVSWDDATAYCDWLSRVTDKPIRLPDEIEWEKAARGDKDDRIYPWGNTFDRLKCNTDELGIRGTTPVGIFPNGASPYGVLDMSGNVWEWTNSWYNENKSGRVVRGGSWVYDLHFARVSVRVHFHPQNANYYFGFRVVAPVSDS